MVSPNAKQESVSEENGVFRVRVSAPALDGRANRAVIELIAAHFGLKESQVRIVHGNSSRKKTIELQA